MQCSLGRFGVETVLFIKPDNALELSKIATQLGISLSVLEPADPRKGRFGKPTGYKHTVKMSQLCFYCGDSYPVKMNRAKAWRHCCKTPKCRARYARDRWLMKNGREHEMQKEQLMRNMREAGLKVTHLKR